MKKKILIFIIGSSFIFADCSDPIKNANKDNTSACVEASSCLKNETTLLVNTLERLTLTSRRLNDALIRHAEGVARCEVYKEYARKNPDMRRWQELAKDCQTHYINLSNRLLTAKKNLNVINKNKDLKRQIEDYEISLEYIKDKCDSYTR